MGLRDLKHSAKKHPKIWKEEYTKRLKGIIKPTRDMDDVPEVRKEWKLTHEWQESVFQLLQKNDKQIIIDLSGIHNLPQGADPEKYTRDLSLFILLFLYCEVPYQMGIYEICMHHKKTGQTEIGKRYPSYEQEISDTLSLENPLFSKMRAPTGLRNFVMKYLEFILHIQKVSFKSEYQKNKFIYSLLKNLFPKNSSCFNQMLHLQMNQVRHYLKGCSKKYTDTFDGILITKMCHGFLYTIVVILDDLENEAPDPVFTPQNFPIYYYLDEYLRLEFCNKTIEDFNYFHEYARESLDKEDKHALWLEYEPDPPSLRYLT